MRAFPAILLALALMLPACEDGISIDPVDDDDAGDDDVGDDDVGDDDVGDDDTGDDDGGDDDTTYAPPQDIEFEAVGGGWGGTAIGLGGEIYMAFGAEIRRWESSGDNPVVAITGFDGLNCQHSYNFEVLGGKGYILGGEYFADVNCTANIEGAIDFVWEFDLDAGTVERVASMDRPRGVLASGVAGGKIYVIGGWNPYNNPSGGNEGVVEAFDGQSWEDVPYTGEYFRVRSPAYATVGDEIFLFGGCTEGQVSLENCPCSSQLVQVFDTATWTFSQRAPMALAGRHFSGQHAVSRGQFIYVFGGATDFSCYIFDDVARYDTVSDTWEVLTDTMTVERKSTGAAVRGDELVVFGGHTCLPVGECADNEDCGEFGQIPSCPFLGAGYNEVGTFLDES